MPKSEVVAITVKFLPVAKVEAGIYKGIEKYLCFSDFCGIITV